MAHARRPVDVATSSADKLRVEVLDDLERSADKLRVEVLDDLERSADKLRVEVLDDLEHSADKLRAEVLDATSTPSNHRDTARGGAESIESPEAATAFDHA
jgi:vacuolar-type H+-ATPase subunit H